MDSNEDASVILCFREDAQGVTVCGTDPCELRDGSWPCWSSSNLNGAPELAVILRMRVTPVKGDRVLVSGQIDRMTRVESRREQRYAWEQESFNRVESVGDAWTLDIGQTADGRQYDVRIRIEGSGSPRMRQETVSSDYVNVTITQDVRDLRSRRRAGRSIQVGELEIGPANEDQTSVRLESSLSPNKGDSTVLFTEISFKNVRIREDSRGRQRMTATFVMDRSLAVGVQPSSDPGMTLIDGIMVVSSFERRITLRPGKTLRIEVPRQDGEEQYIDTDEVLELVLDDPRGTF